MAVAAQHMVPTVAHRMQLVLMPLVLSAIPMLIAAALWPAAGAVAGTLVVGTAALVVVARSLRVGITVTSAEVTVRNVLRTWRVKRDAIAAVDVVPRFRWWQTFDAFSPVCQIIDVTGRCVVADASGGNPHEFASVLRAWHTSATGEPLPT